MTVKSVGGVPTIMPPHGGEVLTTEQPAGDGVGVGGTVAVGAAVGVGVGVGLGAAAQYLPPVLKTFTLLYPAHTIISPPVQTAVCQKRAAGALLVVVAVQLSVPESYLPPVFNELVF